MASDIHALFATHRAGKVGFELFYLRECEAFVI